MKNLVSLALATLIFACNNQNFIPAENALDAAREYKTALLKGNIDKAFFYLQSTNNATQLSLQQHYNSIDNNDKKALQQASIIVKQIVETKQYTQVILSDSYTKKNDTLQVVFVNKCWLVVGKL
jgi:hypothetical protein